MTDSTTDAPPESPPDSPAPETPPETEPETPPDPDANSASEVRARREARNLREKIKDLQTGQDEAVAAAVAEKDETIAGLQGKLVEAQAQLAAVGKLRNPEDVTRFVDVHEVGLDKLDAAIAAVVKERPYLAAKSEHADALPQGQQNGDRPSTQDASEWLREHLQRR